MKAWELILILLRRPFCRVDMIVETQNAQHERSVENVAFSPRQKRWKLLPINF